MFVLEHSEHCKLFLILDYTILVYCALLKSTRQERLSSNKSLKKYQRIYMQFWWYPLQECSPSSTQACTEARGQDLKVDVRTGREKMTQKWSTTWPLSSYLSPFLWLSCTTETMTRKISKRVAFDENYDQEHQ